MKNWSLLHRSAFRSAVGILALAGLGGLAGCGRESSNPLAAPDLRTNPEVAANSAAENFQANEGQDVVNQRGVALGPNAAAMDVHPDVHITTWPYKTTILKHVKATSDYTDPDGTHWYHIKSGWFKTRYYFIPRIVTASPTSTDDEETFPYPTYEGEVLLPIVDASN